MRILMTGGGTAGHVNPALAIAETVLSHEPDAVIEFVGTEKGKEKDLVPAAGYRLHFVKARGIERSLHPRAIPGNLKALYLAAASPRDGDTVSLLRSFAPDLVIGTGGYASWPLLRGAQLLGIPTMLHESNAKPGLALRLLSKRAESTMVNFPITAEKLKSARHLIRVGNPLREGFGSMTRDEAKRALGMDSNSFFILSFGGSLGAEEVNKSMIHAMGHFSARTPGVIHLHGSGSRDHSRCRAMYEKALPKGAPNCILQEYIYQMPLYMTAADLVICRAGAMTLSELALLRRCAILVPSPYVAANHQYENAKTLSDMGAALLWKEEKDQTEAESRYMAEQLTQMIARVYEDQAARRRMEETIASHALGDANRLVWEEIQRVLRCHEKENETEKVRICQ